MAYTHKCDRCGESVLNPWGQKFRIEKLNENGYSCRLDLCEECYQSIETFLNCANTIFLGETEPNKRRMKKVRKKLYELNELIEEIKL